MCKEIFEKLYELEKYSDENITYLKVPENHPKIPFPLNLNDRKKYIITKLLSYFENNSNVDINDKGKKIIIEFKSLTENERNVIIKYKGVLKNNKYEISIE